MKLSVIIPNRNDTVMLGVTVRTCLEELKSIDNDGEIVIVDNSDEDIWKIIKTVNVSPINLGYVEEGKIQLLHQPYPCLYSARQTGIERARGKYVYNIDSHTIIGHNSLLDLVNFMESRKDEKIGMGFAPIGWMSQHHTHARHDIRVDQGTVFGNWGRQYDKPTKICWNFGSRIVNREWFLKVHGGYDFFATKRVAWGGGEMYIPIKSWLLGYECWAVPCSPQYHIGPFSHEIERRTSYRYRQYDGSGKTKLGLGIFAAFYAFGGDEMKEEARKAEKAGAGKNYGLSVDRDWPEAKALAQEAYEDIQKRQVISYWDLMEQRPWTEDWNSWNPDAEIKRTFNLWNIETLPG